jgi:uncharacterized protein with GYD domain
MAKFLIKARYTSPGGIQGLIDDGGTVRTKAINDLITGAGATMEAHYFAFGDIDAFTVVDAPDNATVAAISLAVASTGLATLEVVTLLTPAEIDSAARKSPRYDAPGPNA